MFLARFWDLKLSNSNGSGGKKNVLLKNDFFSK